MDRKCKNDLTAETGVETIYTSIENDRNDPTLALAFSPAKELKTTVDELLEHLG